MDKKIKAINKDTVHAICSGQVVLDLATAVKELIENSIDAGATSIEIRFKDNGVKGIEVIDDGSGVDPDNYESLSLKHYTSKISEFEDVEKVQTFGFRGEALSSLCSLSQLTVITSTKDQAPMGVKLEYNESGMLISNTRVPRSVGTTVQLSNLFHSLPVRQKEFTRNCKKEYGKALAILQAYSIISTSIKITVSNQSENKKNITVMTTTKNKNMIDNILNIYGAKIVSQIMPFQVNLENNIGCVEGFISKPEWGIGRSSMDRQYFFINGRPCVLPKMSSAFNEVYRSFISNQYPLVIADFKIPTNAYDVNVSPDKRTIYIHEEGKIAEMIIENLKAEMEPSRSTFQKNSLLRGTTGLDKEDAEVKDKNNLNENIERSAQISLRSFVSTEGSIFKPKTSSRKRPITSIPEYLSKRVKSVDRKVLDTEEAKILHIEDEIMHTKENGHVEESELRIIKGDTASLETYVAVEIDRDEAHLNDVTEHEATESNESTTQNDIVSDEKQFIEIKSLEGRSRTTGSVMTIDIGDINTLCMHTQSDKDKDENLSQKTDSAEFFSKAGVQNIQDNEKAAKALDRVIHKTDFKRMQVLGQFNLGFMIVSLDQDLYIIDQHASDEKYNFETLPKMVRVSSQKLIRPQTPSLTAAEELIVMDNLEVFKLNGFEVKVLEEKEPTKRIQVLSQPVTKKAMFDQKDFSELVFLLSEHPNEIVRCSRNRATFASMACHKAVRIGQALTKKKMIKIVQNMGEIDQPWNCPHGRPTMRHLLSLSEINRKTAAPKRNFTFRGSLFE